MSNKLSEVDAWKDDDVLTETWCPKCKKAFLISHQDCTVSCSRDDCDYETGRKNPLDKDFPVTETDELYSQDILTDRKCPRCGEFIVSHPDCTESCSVCDYKSR